MPKCSILAPPWHPAVPKMTAKITQVAPKVASENSLGNYYLRNCSQGRFRIGPGHQCDRFRMDFAWIFDGFWMDLDGFWHHVSRILVTFLNTISFDIFLDNLSFTIKAHIIMRCCFHKATIITSWKYQKTTYCI